MAFRKTKPTSPGRRFATYQTRDEVSSGRPHKPLTKGSAKSGQLAALTPLTDAGRLFKAALGQHGKLANKGETDYHGQKVVEIEDTTQGGKLYVAATGDPLPVALKGGAQQGRIAFDDWNADATVEAPKGAIDLSQFGK